MSPSFITFEIRYTQSRCAFVLQFLTSQCHSNILPCSPTLTQSVIFVSLAPNLLYSMIRFLWSLRLLQTRVEVLCLLWRYPILKDKYASLAVLCQVNIISYCLIHMRAEGTGKFQRISQLGLWERSRRGRSLHICMLLRVRRSQSDIWISELSRSFREFSSRN